LKKSSKHSELIKRKLQILLTHFLIEKIKEKLKVININNNINTNKNLPFKFLMIIGDAEIRFIITNGAIIASLSILIIHFIIVNYQEPG